MGYKMSNNTNRWSDEELKIIQKEFYWEWEDNKDKIRFEIEAELYALRTTAPDDVTNKEIERVVEKERERLLEEFKEGLKNKIVFQYRQRKEKRIEEESLNNLEKMWLFLAEKYSVNNREAAKRIFWVMIVTMLKKANVKIKKMNGKVINPRLHFFWFQAARTGKDELLKFMTDIIEIVNKIHREKIGNKDELIKTYKTTGQETIQTMMNHFPEMQRRKKLRNIQNDEIKGIFEEYDLIYSPECSFILTTEKEQNTNSLGEILLEGLEGTSITKRLIKWDGAKTVTKPNFNFIGATRPVSGHKKEIIKSGLQQRGLTLIRELTIDDKKDMVKKFVKLSFPNEEEEKKIKGYMEHLAKGLIEVYEKLSVKEIKITSDKQEQQNIMTLLENFLVKNLEFCENEYPDIEHVDIGHSFVMGLERSIFMLAYKNAIIEKKLIIGVQHFKAAISEIESQIKNLMNWIEITVEIDTKKILTKKRILRVAKQILSEAPDKTMKVDDLAKEICVSFTLSKNTIRNTLYLLCKQRLLNNSVRGYITLNSKPL